MAGAMLISNTRRKDKAYINRFWGIYRTYSQYDPLVLEQKLGAVNKKFNKLSAELNLLDAEKNAITAVIEIKLRKLNAKTKTNQG